jgi:hypothetical protein
MQVGVIVLMIVLVWPVADQFDQAENQTATAASHVGSRCKARVLICG